MNEYTVAKILKQLALLLEKNGFVLYYDKRFPSMKPRINKSCDYLYHNTLGYMTEPLTTFTFHDKDSHVAYGITYVKDFPWSLSYAKEIYPSRYPIYMPLSISFNPYKTYSEDEANELAMKLYKDLMTKPINDYIEKDLSFAQHYKDLALTK